MKKESGKRKADEQQNGRNAKRSKSEKKSVVEEENANKEKVE